LNFADILDRIGKVDGAELHLGAPSTPDPSDDIDDSDSSFKMGVHELVLNLGEREHFDEREDCASYPCVLSEFAFVTQPGYGRVSGSGASASLLERAVL